MAHAPNFFPQASLLVPSSAASNKGVRPRQLIMGQIDCESNCDGGSVVTLFAVSAALAGAAMAIDNVFFASASAAAQPLANAFASGATKFHRSGPVRFSPHELRNALARRLELWRTPVHSFATSRGEAPINLSEICGQTVGHGVSYARTS
jgi:hypothetical protein